MAERKKALIKYVQEAIDRGITDVEQIRQYVADKRNGRVPDKSNIYKLRAELLPKSRAGTADIVDSGSGGSSGGVNPLDSKPIEGAPFAAETVSAPQAVEGEHLAQAYAQDSPSAPSVPTEPTSDNPGSPIAPIEGQPVGAVPTGQPVDLSMFAGIPAVFEQVLFAVPAVKKSTDGYEPEQEDLDNITKYTKIVMEKHSGAVITKHAEELNFIGALSVPFIKGFGRKIGSFMEKVQKKKEEPAPVIVPMKEEKSVPVKEESKPEPVSVLTPQEERQRQLEREIEEANKIVAKEQNPN